MGACGPDGLRAAGEGWALSQQGEVKVKATAPGVGAQLPCSPADYLGFQEVYSCVLGSEGPTVGDPQARADHVYVLATAFWGPGRPFDPWCNLRPGEPVGQGMLLD